MAKWTSQQFEYIKKNYNGSNEQELSNKINLPKEEVIKIANKLKENNQLKSKKLFPIKLDHIYKFSLTDYLIFAGLFFVSLFNYVYTMTPGIAAGDCGELTCAVYFLGGAHSPGYPLYCVLGKLFMWLFVYLGRIVYRLTFLSAFCGAMTIAISYLVFIKFLGRYHHQNKYDNLFFAKLPAIAASLFFLFSEELWAQAVIAEVYTVNSIFLPLLFLIALLYEERYSQNMNLLEKVNDKQYIWNHSIKIMYLFYFLFGLAIGDHHIILGYFIPFFIFFMYTHFKDQTFWKLLGGISIAYGLALISVVYYQLPESFHLISKLIIGVSVIYLFSKMYSENSKITKALFVAAAFFILGLLIYAYMPIRSLANAPLDWGDPEKLENFINVVTRKQYRGFAQNIRTFGTFIQQFVILFQWRLEQFTPYLYIFALIGLFRLYQLNKKWFYFTVSFIIYYDLAFSQFNNFKFTSRDMYFAKVFFIPSYMVSIFWIVLGLEYSVVLFEKYILKKSLVENKKMGWGIGLFLITLSYLPFHQNFDRNNCRHVWLSDSYGKNILKTLEFKSILFTEGGDNQVFTLLYHNYVEYYRPDVNDPNSFDIEKRGIFDQKGNVFLLYGDMMRMSPQQLQESQIVNDYARISTGRPIYYTWKDFWRIGEINKRYNKNYEYRQTGILYRIVKQNEIFNPAIDYWPYYDFEWRQYPVEALNADYLSREIVANYNFQLGDYYMEKAYNDYNLSKQYGYEPNRSKNYYHQYKMNEQLAFSNYRAARIYGFDMTAIHFNLGLLLEQRIRILQQENNISEINKVLDEAINCYITAADIENKIDNAPRAYFTAGRAYERKAYFNPDKETEYMSNALKNYQMAVGLSPGYNDAQMAARRAEAIVKYPSNKLAEMEKNLAKDPKNEQLYFELVRVYIDRMEGNRAVEILEKATRYLPTNINILFNLANLYQQLKRHQEAINTFLKISRIQPNEPTIYFYTAENYYALKKYPESYNQYKKFINLAFNINNDQIRNMVTSAQQKVRMLAPYYEK